jgi:hypothetical protein
MYRSSFQTRTGDVDCGVDRKPIHVGADYGCKLSNSTCIERGLSDFDPYPPSPTLLALPYIRPSPPSIAVVLLTYLTCHVILSSYAARTPPQYPPISTLRFSDISLHDLPSLNLHFAISSYPTVPYLPFLHSVGRLCKSVPSPTSFVAITFFPFFLDQQLGAFWPWSGGALCTVPGSSVCVVNSMMKVFSADLKSFQHPEHRASGRPAPSRVRRFFYIWDNSLRVLCPGCPLRCFTASFLIMRWTTPSCACLLCTHASRGLLTPGVGRGCHPSFHQRDRHALWRVFQVFDNLDGEPLGIAEARSTLVRCDPTPGHPDRARGLKVSGEIDKNLFGSNPGHE